MYMYMQNLVKIHQSFPKIMLRTDRRTDGQPENSIPHTSYAGGITILSHPSRMKHACGMLTCSCRYRNLLIALELSEFWILFRGTRSSWVVSGNRFYMIFFTQNHRQRRYSKWMVYRGRIMLAWAHTLNIFLVNRTRIRIVTSGTDKKDIYLHIILARGQCSI